MEYSARLSILLGFAVALWWGAVGAHDNTQPELAAWINGKAVMMQTWSNVGFVGHDSGGSLFYILDQHG